jgi:hypothetical protein
VAALPETARPRQTQGDHAVKALTVKQPWADNIAHSTKRTENRTWATKYRGLVLIHAGLAEDRTPLPGWAVPFNRPNVRGAVVALARISDCHFDSGCCRPWGEPEVYHWALANVSTLPTPVPCKGRLGLWAPPADVVTAVLEQEREAMR